MIFDGPAIAKATHGSLARGGPFGPVTTDSRRIPPGAWFVALRGDRFDGHTFLAHAAAAGCAGAVVAADAAVPEGWSAGLVVVPDTLVALQDLGRYAREIFTGPVVGITGSAGKTSTRVMVVDVLAEIGRVHHTQGNLNNHIGLPLTLCATPPDAELLVLEMGMNHPGEINLLQGIARPTVRLVTNVGAAHVEGCGSLDGVARAKQELFDGAAPGDVLCVNDDDALVRAMPLPTGVQVVRYGSGAACPIRLTDVAVDAEALRTRLRIETPDGVVRATLDVPGEHLARNALAAVAVGWALRVPVERMGPALARFAPEGMRNRVERVDGVTILNDAYNANPLSMAAALRTLAALPGPRFAILGDMLELGDSEADAHVEVLALASALGIEHVWVTGDRMARAAIGTAVEVHPDVEHLCARLLPALRRLPSPPGASLLVKGSRGARMERVVDLLRAPRTHPGS